MKSYLIPLVVLVTVLMGQPMRSGSSNQQTENTCPVVIQTAMAATASNCDSTGRNEVCYGHILLEAQPQPGIAQFSFEQPGNRVDVARVQSLHLSPLEVGEDVWGIALMRLQANLPSSAMEDITLLVFGDVMLQNAVPVPSSAEVSVTANSYINVRQYPSTNATIVGTLAPGQAVTARERLDDQTWVRVELEDGTFGWVHGSLLSQPATPDALNVADAASPYYRPMQAFYFQSGQSESTCPQQSTDGMVIQTPEGVGEVTLLINEVNIQIGSTVFFQAQPAEEMTIMTLEGHATVTAEGSTYTAYAGSQVTVPLTQDLKPAGAPTMPEPYDETLARSLTLSTLSRAVEAAPALSVEEIETLVNQTRSSQPNCPGNSCNAPGQSDSPPPGQANNPSDCPGNSCNAPGQTGNTPPGQSDNPPPGQGANPPGQSNNPPGQPDNPPGQNNPPGQANPPPGQAGIPPPGQANNPPPGQADTPPPAPNNDNPPPGQADNPPPAQDNNRPGQPDIPPNCPGSSCNAPGQSDNPPPGQGGTPPGQVEDPPPDPPVNPPDCPGNSCNAPGQSDNPPPGQGGTPPGQVEDPPPDPPVNPPDCPGNSCNAPGQSDNPPPGQGGTPPGQVEDPPPDPPDCPGNSCNAPGQSDNPPIGSPIGTIITMVSTVITTLTD